MDTIARWLNAWKQTNYGWPICVIHNSDDPLERYNILRFNPDFYFQRNNVGQDMGAFQDVINGKYDLKWDNLFWFADDMIPMKKNFLDNFVAKMGDLVGHHRTSYNVRTCAFSISKRAAIALGFRKIETRQDCLDFETRFHDNMAKTLENKGFAVRAAHCPDPGMVGYKPITYEQYADIVWDSHYAPQLNLWEEYDRVFGDGYRLPLHY